ncbi:hypothetical protein PT974_06104 [Cladobotryum mycophilum]|uniref:Uncharacterized protein n=1 Tax=Cladobotryum mycophilum TaxID=491253 RepID=A0ABR0SKW2_9HYPO
MRFDVDPSLATRFPAVHIAERWSKLGLMPHPSPHDAHSLCGKPLGSEIRSQRTAFTFGGFIASI